MTLLPSMVAYVGQIKTGKHPASQLGGVYREIGARRFHPGSPNHRTYWDRYEEEQQAMRHRRERE